jgi:hypothetical protein
MSVLEVFQKGKNDHNKQASKKLILRGPEITFYVPEGAIPGGITPEEQAIAAERSSKLTEVFSAITHPITQMLHTAATLREEADLGNLDSQEKKTGVKRISTVLFGRWTIAQYDTPTNYIHRKLKSTEWSLLKAGLHKKSTLKYSIYDDELLKVDAFKTEFSSGRRQDPFAELKLTYNTNQQLTKAVLNWNCNKTFPADSLAGLMGTNKAAATFIREFCQPTGKSWAVNIAKVWNRGIFEDSRGSIQFVLGPEPQVILNSASSYPSYSFESTFQYDAIQHKLVRDLDSYEIREFSDFGFSTQTELPAKALVAGYHSLLGMITPQLYTRG